MITWHTNTAAAANMLQITANPKMKLIVSKTENKQSSIVYNKKQVR